MPQQQGNDKCSGDEQTALAQSLQTAPDSHGTGSKMRVGTRQVVAEKRGQRPQRRQPGKRQGGQRKNGGLPQNGQRSRKQEGVSGKSDEQTDEKRAAEGGKRGIRLPAWEGAFAQPVQRKIQQKPDEATADDQCQQVRVTAKGDGRCQPAEQAASHRQRDEQYAQAAENGKRQRQRQSRAKDTHPAAFRFATGASGGGENGSAGDMRFPG